MKQKHLEPIKNRERHNDTEVEAVRDRLVGRKSRPFQKTQMFRVPNTEKGRAFIDMLREVLNRETYTITVRPRSANRRAKGIKSDYYCRMDQADFFGVYIEKKPRIEQTFPAEESPFRPPTVQRMDT